MLYIYKSHLHLSMQLMDLLSSAVKLLVLYEMMKRVSLRLASGMPRGSCSLCYMHGTADLLSPPVQLTVKQQQAQQFASQPQCGGGSDSLSITSALRCSHSVRSPTGAGSVKKEAKAGSRLSSVYPPATPLFSRAGAYFIHPHNFLPHVSNHCKVHYH